MQGGEQVNKKFLEEIFEILVCRDIREIFFFLHLSDHISESMLLFTMCKVKMFSQHAKKEGKNRLARKIGESHKELATSYLGVLRHIRGSKEEIV